MKLWRVVAALSAGLAPHPERGPSRVAVWLVSFGFAAFIACLVQLVLLPYLAPDLHEADGLLIEGDWVYHHAQAVRLAERIESDGWGAWRLRPAGENSLHGITAAIYALIAPQPWALIPVYAALHATSTLVLFLILRLMVPGWLPALCGALPFLMFPSSMITYAQITKDAYTICGGFLFVYGWLRVAGSDRPWSDGRRSTTDIALIASGAVLTWSMRPYAVQILIGVACLIATLLSAVYVLAAARNRMAWARSAVAIAGAWGLTALLLPLAGGAGINMEPPEPPPVATRPVEADLPGAADEPTAGPAGGAERRVTAARPQASPGASPDAEPASVPDPPVAEEPPEPVPSPYPVLEWERTLRIPRQIDDKLFSLASVRYRWLGSTSRSAIDLDVMPGSAREIVRYLPRATQIALLAPFPNRWAESGSFRSTTLMRRVASVEMLLLYATWLGLALTVWRLRSRTEILVVFTYAFAYMIVLVIGLPNLGTLYRVRYGPLMLLAGLGVAASLATWRPGRVRDTDRGLDSPAGRRPSL